MNENENPVVEPIGGRKPKDWEHEGDLVDSSAENRGNSDQSPDDHGDGPISNTKQREPAY